MTYRELKARSVLRLLWLLAISQYGAFIYFYLLNPAPDVTYFFRIRSIEGALFQLGIIVFVCWMVSFDIRAMRHYLKPLSNQMVAKHWSIGAASLSLPSAYSYLEMLDWLARKLSLNMQLTSSQVLMLVFAVAGLNMPFVLFTCWLKYRYREDEF